MSSFSLKSTLLTMLIRNAAPNDLPRLTALLKILFSLEKDFSFNERIQADGLQQMIDNERGCILVAVASGSVVGMCSGQLTVSTAEGGPALLVEDVVVFKKWQKKGIGKKLMNEIATWAKEKGVHRLQLLADKTNTQALKFYTSLGWRHTQLTCLRKHLKGEL